ncbi:ISL3 family transposase (plasmid) [Rhizobium sp. CB3090]|nr:ISL3 family transposase [Rhizobium sp. CB3090]WFU12789.1 ISL3 family transposase [Rhizobium sp. CB3090]
MAKRILPLIPPSLVVDHVQQSRGAISIDCRFRSTGAKCPDCRKASHRVHSRYERHLADLPWQGRAVTIILHVRRLRCSNERCRRRIFAENVGDVTWRYCRRTRRLGDVHRSIGMALGGEAGMRLVTRLGMPVSADTILRIARTQPSGNCEAPRILGVDDWAWRRGQRYGTILVDLETNNVVDLLPDREKDTLSGWLADHPGVEVIARDRAGAYARGAREGAPKAQQIADRWHLLRNCSDALQNVVERQYRVIRDVGKALMAQIDTDDQMRRERGKEGLLQGRAARQQNNRHQDRRALFEEVIRLNGMGWSQLAIKRELGIDLKTIRKWLKDNQPGTWERTVFTENPADAHADYVRRRWFEGCRNATRLYREVCDRGYRESVKTFRQWVKVRLRDGVPAPILSRASRKSSWRTPSSRLTVRLLTAEADTLPRNERAFVNAISSASPDVATAADLARRFQSMICNRETVALKPWLHDAATGPMSSFARGIRRDVEAVQAALTLPWSTGPVEGKINKLKLIKRSMYGRAGMDLLRSRIIGT